MRDAGFTRGKGLGSSRAAPDVLAPLYLLTLWVGQQDHPAGAAEVWKVLSSVGRTGGIVPGVIGHGMREGARTLGLSQLLSCPAV